MRDRRPDHAHGADHRLREEVLGFSRRRQVADHDRVQDLHGRQDRGHPERAELGKVAHLRDRRHEDDEEAAHVDEDPEGTGDEDLPHGDGGRLDLRLLRVAVAREQELIVLEEAFRHLHGVGDRTGGDDHGDHEHQGIERDVGPAGKAKTPDHGRDRGDHGDEDAMEPPEVSEQQREHRDDGADGVEPDLLRVLQDPAHMDRLAGHEDLNVVRLLPRLDGLHVIEDGLVDLAAVQAVGHEAGGDQRPFLVLRDQPPEDEGRILSHELTDVVCLVLGLRRLFHQDVGVDAPVGADLDDARAARGDRLDLVVVHGVGRIAMVELFQDLLARERALLLQLRSQLFAGLGLRVVAFAVERLGDARDLLQRLRGEDRSILHHDRDGDEGRCAEHARELVLGVDEGMPGIERPGRGIHAHDRAGQPVAGGRQGRIHDRVEEEQSLCDEPDGDQEAVPRDEARKAQGRGLADMVLRYVGHEALFVGESVQ